jgi:CRISPR type III-A-associated protein Csm2
MGMQDAFRKAGIEPKNTSSASGYFDDDGNLRPEFVSRNSVEPKVKSFAQDHLKISQLRKFFGHCREIERRLRTGSTWEAERPQVQKLSAFAADALGKGNIPQSFSRFINENVARVHSRTDFVDGFMQYFEAVVGFAALHMREERKP